MEIPNLPNLDNLVSNGRKTAENFERRPMGTAYYVTVIALAVVIIYLAVDNYNLRKENSAYGKAAFDKAMGTAQQTIDVQAQAIQEASRKIDTAQVVNIQPLINQKKVQK